MDGAGLTFNEVSGLWESSRGQTFVRNEFDPERPALVNVTGERWMVTHSGLECFIDWREIGLPASLNNPMKAVVISRLKKSAPSTIASWRRTLMALVATAAQLGLRLEEGFAEIRASQWLQVWTAWNPHNRTVFRELYKELANKRLAGARQDVVVEMRSWKARNDVVHLRDVLEWDEQSGPLTSVEAQLVRDELAKPPAEESWLDLVTRLFAATCHETLKRSNQLLTMKPGAMTVIPAPQAGLPAEYFLRVPGAKAQTGTSRLWPISESLGLELVDYAGRDEVRSLQEKHGVFFVIPRDGGPELRWERLGQLSAADMSNRLENWARRRQIRSPRTNDFLMLRPRRFRHTGASAMALQGVPRAVIQEALEHDSPLSADAYIQAVGAELLPVVERASERGIGHVFEAIAGRYFFKGEIQDALGPRPILIPVVLENRPPAVVGSCGKDGQCPKHPFWACYNGCPNFLAWREANHRAALDFVQNELDRWSHAEGGKARSKLYKDFERIATAIVEVMVQIEHPDAGEPTK